MENLPDITEKVTFRRGNAIIKEGDLNTEYFYILINGGVGIKRNIEYLDEHDK